MPFRFLFGAMIALVAMAVAAPDDAPQTPPAAPVPAAPTVSLSPAVVMLKSQPGQSWTQSFRLRNQTPMSFQFDIDIQDVVIRDGKREYVPAGQIDGGIAATSVATPRSITIGPQQEGVSTATITLPPQTGQRAVIVFFRGKTQVSSKNGDVGLGASLGALVTFTIGDTFQVESTSFSSEPQSETRNLTVSHDLVNKGGEPVIPKGSMAILDDAGKRVSKATFEPKRLLPGERVTFTASNPAQLKPGHYRVLSSFEFEGKLINTGGEITVP